jgi:glycosyltransferase involved in cell wall biosynthesis/GT2 family glycosyltransferase
MRIAWVTPYLPDPTGGAGNVLEFELLRLAADHHEIHLVTAELPAGETVFDVGSSVVTAEGATWCARPGPRRPLGVAWRLPVAHPSIELFTKRLRLPALRDTLASLFEREPVDLVHVTMGEIAPVVRVASVPTTLLLFDVYSRQAERERDLAEGGFRRLRWETERRKLARWERHWYARFDSVACVSSVDADVVSRMMGGSVEVIPNPIPEAFFSLPSCPRSSDTVVFIANLAYRPNIDAMRWLVDEIWPAVLRRRPGAHLEIVGRQPHPDVVSAVERAGATLHADVADVRPFYWRAAVAVAPIRLGSGKRNKILHAFATNTPVVSTPTALEGIDALPGEHLLVAAGAQAFADAIVETLDDPPAAARRASSARGLAEKAQMKEVGERLDAWWQGTADRAGKPRTLLTRVPLRTVEPGGSATVVVCTRGRAELLERSLRSIAASLRRAPGVDCLVVIQGGGDAEVVKRELGRHGRVIVDGGVGTSRARNLASAAASADILLFTDDDCEVPPSWVVDHLAALADGSAVASFGSVVGLSRFGQGADPTAHPARHYRGSAPWWIGHSSNMAVRRSALLAVGGFDERLGPGARARVMGEDNDLIYRLLRDSGMVTAGVGAPVQHADWRTDSDHRHVLRGYERGAGAWIGKAVREEGSPALRYVRLRFDLFRSRAPLRSDPTGITMSFAAFCYGLARGLAMSPWSVPRDRWRDLRPDSEPDSAVQ